MTILFTICGRAGSKGLAAKNLKTFHGYPLIAYTLAAMDLFKEQSSHQIDVALNTDSKELQKTIEDYPDVLLIDRKKEHATDTASKMAVIRDTYLQAKKIRQKEYDYVIDLDLTSPLRTVQDIFKLIEKKKEHPELDVVFSVVESRRNPFFNMVKEEGNSVSLVNASTFTSRQQAPAIYDMNASMYLYDPKFLQENEYIFNGNCGVIQMQDYMVLDIDSEEDFKWMEYIYVKLLEEEGIQDIYSHIPKMTIFSAE
ncbi:acylneuraminate cytidylyltransferase family protein [Carnobacterium sp. CS13]|uniref:acylneuraminate cytidylyltransferase family protein n=1 Tax=Carnobacterium sp. CS13 TaxID=2800128 RepID=UPI00191145C2|nr:acylneuraminate cytidylyltransferase family protein [Carnobacterium sp. CS13]QQP69572.1 acylneuraminate cytidylyltransferase family protein [Carnobacterium sp. CS13]